MNTSIRRLQIASDTISESIYISRHTISSYLPFFPLQCLLQQSRVVILQGKQYSRTLLEADQQTLGGSFPLCKQIFANPLTSKCLPIAHLTKTKPGVAGGLGQFANIAAPHFRPTPAPPFHLQAPFPCSHLPSQAHAGRCRHMSAT